MAMNLSKFVEQKVDALGPRARQVLEYISEHSSATNRDIAKALGICEQRVSQIKHSNRFLAVMPELARKKIKSAQLLAADKVVELVKQKENLKVSFDAARVVLESEKILNSGPQTQINVFQSLKTEELHRIVEETKEVPKNIIDAEIVEDLG